MANLNDSKIIKEMMAVNEIYIAQYFAENSHKIIDNSTYWNVLGTLWKLGGTVIQQELWIGLFLCGRKNKHKIMKSRERKVFNKLPKIVTAYRAVNNKDEASTAISWSLSESIVKKLFTENGKREIIKRTFNKSDVFAFFDRRGEYEILVNIK